MKTNSIDDTMNICQYYGFSLLHKFSYIQKTGVYISLPKNDKNMDDKTLASLNQWHNTE